jgi:diaminopimelate epimerase
MSDAFELATIPFVKANACRNDFLIIEGERVGGDIAAFTRRVCDRRRGVGADGVEWLYPATDVDIEARLVNADGSAAEISGNGTRCVAAYLASQQGKEKFVIRTGAGLKTCVLTARNGNVYEFETALGSPVVEEELSLVLNRGVVRGIPVSMGNPHYVVFVDEILPDWIAEASEIGHHPHFKQGVNVEVVAIEDANTIDVRFFERGVGETLSSGTGSCASAVAAIATQGGKSPVQVRAPGGVQTVRWEQEIFLRGPAEVVCRGEILVR